MLTNEKIDIARNGIRKILKKDFITNADEIILMPCTQ